MECRHQRGLDGMGYCRMCGYPVNQEKKQLKLSLAKITHLIEEDERGFIKVSDTDREYLKDKQRKLSELAFK